MTLLFIIAVFWLSCCLIWEISIFWWRVDISDNNNSDWLRSTEAEIDLFYRSGLRASESLKPIDLDFWIFKLWVYISFKFPLVSYYLLISFVSNKARGKRRVLLSRPAHSTFPQPALTLALGECMERMQRGEESGSRVRLQSLHCQTQDYQSELSISDRSSFSSKTTDTKTARWAMK